MVLFTRWLLLRLIPARVGKPCSEAFSDSPRLVFVLLSEKGGRDVVEMELESENELMSDRASSLSVQ